MTPALRCSSTRTAQKTALPRCTARVAPKLAKSFVPSNAKYGTVQTKLPTATAKKVIAGRAGVCGYRKSGIESRVFGIQVRGLT